MATLNPYSRAMTFLDPSGLRAPRLPRFPDGWSLTKAVLWRVLLTLVGLTTLYVIIFGLIPSWTGHHIASQVIAGMPALNHSVLMVHILTALPPLFLGWIGFSKRMRKRSLSFHRTNGNIYCFCIWVSALTGFYLGAGNDGGWLSRIGYCALATTWFATTWMGFTTAKSRNFIKHREWMIRSYAVTLAVVTVRPIHFVPMFVDIGDINWSPIAAWGCWLPNIILAEIYVRRTDFKGQLRPRKTSLKLT